MLAIKNALVNRLFLVVLAATPAVATDDSLSYDSNGVRWNDVCSLAIGDTAVHWAVGDSGKVLKTANDDSSAGYAIGKGLYNLCAVSFADASHGWIVGYKRDDPERLRGVVFRTTTGGDSPGEWTATFPVIRPGINVRFLKVQAVNTMRVWVMYDDGHVLWSNDGGVNWLVATKRDGVEYGGKPGSQGRDHEK